MILMDGWDENRLESSPSYPKAGISLTFVSPAPSPVPGTSPTLNPSLQNE